VRAGSKGLGRGAGGGGGSGGGGGGGARLHHTGGCKGFGVLIAKSPGQTFNLPGIAVRDCHSKRPDCAASCAPAAGERTERRWRAGHVEPRQPPETGASRPSRPKGLPTSWLVVWAPARPARRRSASCRGELPLQPRDLFEERNARPSHRIFSNGALKMRWLQPEKQRGWLAARRPQPRAMRRGPGRCAGCLPTCRFHKLLDFDGWVQVYYTRHEAKKWCKAACGGGWGGAGASAAPTRREGRSSCASTAVRSSLGPAQLQTSAGRGTYMLDQAVVGAQRGRDAL
jgi:hypothetical protein